MAKVIFVYEGISTEIQCSKEEKMSDICNNFKQKRNIDSPITYLYKGNIMDLDLSFKDYQKNEQTMKIIVVKNEEEGNKNNSNNDIISNIISSINNQNDYIDELKQLIQNIMNNKSYNQLKLVNPILIQLAEDNKQIISKLNKLSQVKIGHEDEIKNENQNKIKIEIKNEINCEKKETINEKKNEIICIYDKQEDEIRLLYDYQENISSYIDKFKDRYRKATKDEAFYKKNMEIFINGKKIDFSFKYKSDERGEIEVKYIFKKVISDIAFMFKNCLALRALDLSSFDTSNVKDMSYFFYEYCFLNNLDLSTLNTTNVTDMYSIFYNCYNLKSLELSSFNTSKVISMGSMFKYCNR